MNTAHISDCGQYRYELTRDLPGTDAPLVFVMLNPSTADASVDDPTIRRCIGFAMRENAQRLIVVNLYAYRATDPRQLRVVRDPHGPENEATLRRHAVRSQRIVCAWGASVPNPGYAIRTANGLRHYGAKLYCLGRTQNGSPRHPLYVHSDAPLKPF